MSHQNLVCFLCLGCFQCVMNVFHGPSMDVCSGRLPRARSCEPGQDSTHAQLDLVMPVGKPGTFRKSERERVRERVRERERERETYRMKGGSAHPCAADTSIPDSTPRSATSSPGKLCVWRPSPCCADLSFPHTCLYS